MRLKAYLLIFLMASLCIITGCHAGTMNMGYISSPCSMKYYEEYVLNSLKDNGYDTESSINGDSFLVDFRSILIKGHLEAKWSDSGLWIIDQGVDYHYIEIDYNYIIEANVYYPFHNISVDKADRILKEAIDKCTIRDPNNR